MIRTAHRDHLPRAAAGPARGPRAGRRDRRAGGRAQHRSARLGRRPADAVTRPDAVTAGGRCRRRLARDGAIGQRPTDLERIRADVAFWSDRAAHAARPTSSARTRLGRRRDRARPGHRRPRALRARPRRRSTRALAANPDYRPARGVRGGVLVALHRFADARDARPRRPRATRRIDPAALATLGDAALDARRPRRRPRRVRASSTARRRSGAARASGSARLAFIDGDPADGRRGGRASAVDAARPREPPGERAGLVPLPARRPARRRPATGPAPRAAFAAALAADPGSALGARGAGPRAAAADGCVDAAIAHLDAAHRDRAAARSTLARRADLLPAARRRRATPRRAATTARRSWRSPAGRRRGRGLRPHAVALPGRPPALDPARALALAEAEIAVRKDVYGYDALAWALLANGRADGGRRGDDEALALGTRDASCSTTPG